MTKLPGIFSNGMILQRDRTCAVWGTEDTSGISEVKVTLEGKTYTSEVKDGSFCVILPPHEAATGLTIEITGSTKIVLMDVCYGDVYLLTGQSNMELPVYRTRDVSQEEIEASDYPYIRQYRVTPQFRLSEEKLADLPILPWTKATPDQIGEMSAAGFYCAHRIYDEKKVPIGLVLGAQGGSNIESWMPAELLKQYGDYEKIFAPFLEDGALQKYLMEKDGRIGAMRRALERPEDEVLCRQIPEDAVDFAVPGMILSSEVEKIRREKETEETRKLSGGEVVLPEGFTGVAWFYKEFELKEEPGDSAFAYVGNLIDADQTFINGELIGRTEYRYPPRKYPFHPGILKKGKNLLCVRLLIEGGSGGFVGAHPYYLTSGSERIDLTGTWKMVFGAKNETPIEAGPVGQESSNGLMGQEVPTALYKATIRPLLPYSFRGIWWYQGEANSADPRRYNEKFRDMIAFWRQGFDQALPLICVEMADYTDPILNATPDGWQEIQAQQRAAAEEVPDCRVVSARDLTSPLELHPQRKSELGARMAEAAMQLYY